MEGKGKKEQILEAAMSLILKNGYSHTSVEDITNSIGIAKGSFYTYFKSKNLLLRTIIEEQIKSSLEQQEKQLSEGKNFEEILLKNIVSRVKFLKKDLKRQLVLINLARNVDVLGKDVRDLMVKIETINHNFIKRLLNRYNSQLKLTENEIDQYSQIINSIIRGFKLTNIFFDDNSEDNFFIKDIAEAEKRINHESFDEGINFIYKNILKMLK